MKKILFALIAVVLFSSHDMFLKLDTYFLQPNASANIKLFNGTFEKSENVIARNRMLDVSLVGNGKRTQLDTTQWSEKDSMTILSFKTGAAGTWVAGVSTAPRNIALVAADFNEYLEHDGVLDMLEWRKANGALDNDAVEKYSKHVKAIFQVGDQKTDDWQTELGYPIEFVPLSNPYDLQTGDALKFKLLRAGKPLANQLVSVDSERAAKGHSHDNEHADETAHGHEHTTGEESAHSHDTGEQQKTEQDHGHDHASDNATAHQDDHDHGNESGKEHSHDKDPVIDASESHHHHAETQVRTDANGEFTVQLSAEGIWFLRTIQMEQSDAPGETHESNWATLTFEVGHGHSHAGEEHRHADEQEAGTPAYVYWIGSLLVLGGLFFWFNRKTA